MKVKAKAIGVYDNQVRELGDIFEVKGKPAYWMEEVIEVPPPPVEEMAKVKESRFKFHLRVPFFEIKIGGEL